MGIIKCKQRTRELVFWPGMSKQIEDNVSRCSACLEHRNKAPMVIQPIPSLPWSKVATDLCELDGNHHLVMVDYFSNFIEVAPRKRNTRTSVVVKGPQFTSAEFREFTSKYGINNVTSSPLHQQVNGLAEKDVQTVKNVKRKCAESGDDIYLSLLELRNTPRDRDIGSPMQRPMGRRGKTLLPMTNNLRKPAISDPEKVSSKLLNHRHRQKDYYDRGTKAKEEIQPTDTIRIRIETGCKPAELVWKTNDPRSYVVKAGDSAREYRRNTRMLMKTK
ncbi:Uncharacterized protein K02A2.6 [Mizuhopecten yessoensis]|uniref:Uncharacterized protein K02A2.6 n=1 Tax=Mizuhopecten yessoensis TaxID=6573 RepID=A0A210QDG4_MIZYE|nr:Uncharacterized protein K02A2.6 [Mizuhopecten yessoensis]